MVGGKISSTPWYLTLGNPYSPWFASNHIIVSTCSIETSNEMGFNDQPQRLKATFGCRFSRPLGKQELMRMFNNTYRRNYSSTPPTSVPGLFDNSVTNNTVSSWKNVAPGHTDEWYASKVDITNKSWGTPNKIVKPNIG